jgi:hypothetical protein
MLICSEFIVLCVRKKSNNVIINSFETIVSKFLFTLSNVHLSTWIRIRIRICIPAVVVLTIFDIKFPDSSETGLILSVSISCIRKSFF